MTREEAISLLMELFDAPASYPGPSPGSGWSPTTSFPPVTRKDLFGDPDEREGEKKRYRDNASQKRENLRRLSVWLAMRPSRSPRAKRPI